MSVATAEQVRFSPEGAVVVEAAEAIVRAESLRAVAGLALRASEVSLAEDLCDLTAVHSEYEQFARSVRPRAESEVVKPKADKRESLYDMAYGAAIGNPEARAGVEANAETIVAEYALKDGSILEVDAHMSPDGQIVQFGQTTRDRQQKTLEWYPDQSPVLLANTNAEGRNVRVIEHLWRQGHLDGGKKVLEISLVPPASSRELFDYGYFLDRMTAIARLTEITKAGKVTIESGLVGGVDQDVLPEYRPDETLADEMARYDVALKERFDDYAAGEMLEILGVEGAQNLSTTGKLEKLVIVPGDIDILDVMQLWDRIVSAYLRKPVFYGLRTLYKQHCDGRTPTRADYIAQRERSRRQRADLQSTAAQVAAETIRRRGEARNDLQMIRLLSSVAKNHITEYVIERPAIDARLIIGREAAIWAAEARLRYEWGDIQGAKESTAKAQETARPTGCPTTGSDKTKEISRERKPAGKDSKDDKAEESSTFKKKAKAREKDGKKTEWMRCVHCPLCDRDGVDARIDYYPKEKMKRITCSKCCRHKEYSM